MKTANPAGLADTRIQLHWASQLQSAVADAMLDHAEDDSHSNLEWDAVKQAMVGRSGVSIRVPEFTLLVADESLPLAGQTLDESLEWLSRRVGARLALRDYEMPDHAVGAGQPLNPDADQLEEIANWFSFAQELLEEQGELRIWPHHFDLGFWTPLERKGTSIGGGFLIGDRYYDEPYFYINPYGIDRPDDLPPLDAGHWTRHWFGAVLTAEELGDRDQGRETVKRFVDSAMNASRALLTAKL